MRPSGSSTPRVNMCSAIQPSCRPLAIRDDPHAPPAHAVLEVGSRCRLGFGGLHPVIGGPGFVLVARADEGELLRTRDVLRMAAMQVAARIGLLVQLEKRAV